MRRRVKPAYVYDQMLSSLGPDVLISVVTVITNDSDGKVGGFLKSVSNEDDEGVLDKFGVTFTSLQKGFAESAAAGLHGKNGPCPMRTMLQNMVTKGPKGVKTEINGFVGQMVHVFINSQDMVPLVGTAKNFPFTVEWKKNVGHQSLLIIPVDGNSHYPHCFCYSLRVFLIPPTPW